MKCRFSGVERSQQVDHLDGAAAGAAIVAGLLLKVLNTAVLRLFRGAGRICGLVDLWCQGAYCVLHSGNRELLVLRAGVGRRACNAADSRYDSRSDSVRIPIFAPWYCKGWKMGQENLPGLQLAIEQIRFAREYTLSLLDTIPEPLWFEQPAGVPSCVAWQVGHLAMAQYGLCLFRIRGRAEADLTLMSSAFRKKFSRGTAPDPNPVSNPAVTEIRQVFERVYEQSLLEMPGYGAEVLQEAVDRPWAVQATKLGCLLFCSHHEMIHAGQLGLLRRLLGLAPVR